MPLDFDEVSVPTVGKFYERDIKSALLEARNPYAPPELFKQIGIFFAYYKRDAAKAIEFLEKYRRTLNTYNEYNSLEYAEVCNHIGRAHTNDGAYKDDKLFFEALEIYSEYQKKVNEPRAVERIQFGIAFSLQQIGLIRHRQFENKEAQDYFVQARGIYEGLGNYPMYVAEANHLLGVSYVREGRIVEGLASLELAYATETIYESEKKSKHYLTFITAQSLADAKCHQALREPKLANKLLAEALDLLQSTLVEQINYYKVSVNADIAKTYAFIGANFFAQKNYLKALEFHIGTLGMKFDLFHDLNHGMVKFTIKDIHAVFQAWNKNFESIYDQRPEITKSEMLAFHNNFTRLHALFERCSFEINIPLDLLKKLDKYFSKNEPTMAGFYQHLVDLRLKQDDKILSNAAASTVFGKSLKVDLTNVVRDIKRPDTPRPI